MSRSKSAALQRAWLVSVRRRRGRQCVSIEIELTVFNDEDGGATRWRIDNRVRGQHLITALEIIAARQAQCSR